MLGRSQHNPVDPDEPACRWLPPGRLDPRSPLSNYTDKVASDVRRVLEASAPFRKESAPKNNLRSRNSAALVVKGSVLVADDLHFTPIGQVYRKIQVRPQNRGKLYTCQKDNCILCRP